MGVTADPLRPLDTDDEPWAVPEADPATMTDAEKLRTLATWFDHFDDWREATNHIAPGISEYREVQSDLRRIAARLERPHADGRYWYAVVAIVALALVAVALVRWR